MLNPPIQEAHTSNKTKVHRQKLSEFFKRFAPKYLLGTTYTASPVFFETSLLTKVDKSKLEGAVILCDRKGFRRAIQEVGALRAASSTYSLVYPPHSGTFHPKVWIMANDERVAVLCGSGNMTQSGFMDNVELFDSFEIESSGQNQQLGKELLLFVRGLLSMWNESAHATRPALRVIPKLITQIERITNSNSLSAENPVSFLSSFEGDFPSLLAARVDCKELKIASPYFGGKLGGITQLTDVLQPAEWEAFPAFHNKGVDLDPAELQQLQGKQTRQLDIQKEGFAHLKLYGLVDHTDNYYTFTGSVNATQSALTGSNVEAGILRQVDEEYFHTLFNTKLPEKVIEQEYLDYSDSEEAVWLSSYAILKDGSLSLHMEENAAKHLPLSNVSLQWVCGAQRERQNFSTLFEGKRDMYFKHDAFPKTLINQQNSSAIELTGTTADGKSFRSFTLVENYFDLTATPQQRSATNALNSLLSNGKIAEIHGINSVFEILNRSMEKRVSKDELSSKSNSSSQPQEKPPRPSVVPIWPPVVASSTDSKHATNTQAGSMEWLQKALGWLFRPEAKEDLSDNDLQLSPDLNDEKDGDSTVNQVQVDKAIRSKLQSWLCAEKHFTNLESRLRGIALCHPSASEEQKMKHEVPNKEQILPVAFATFILTYLAHPGDDTPLTHSKDRDGNKRTVQTVEPKSKFIERFLRLLIDRRPQSDDSMVASDHPYRDKSHLFPPLIEEIESHPELSIHHDFPLLLVAFFALLKSDIDRNDGNDQHLTLLWLKFRIYTNETLTLNKETCTEIANKTGSYAPSLKDEIGHNGIERIISGLDAITWKNFSGYQQFYAILCINKGAEPNPKVIKNINNWDMHQQVLMNKRNTQPFIPVDGYHRRCEHKKCANSHSDNPVLSPLQSLTPCICPSCGTALIPKNLIDAYKTHGY